MQYCKNINKDIDITEISDNYILVDDNIVHLYGFKGLSTYTVQAGELYRGDCINNVYQFTFVNSIIYNDLLNDKENIFSLQIIKPIEYKARCILPSGLSKDNIFNINCNISGTTDCPIIPPDKDITVGDNNPNDILSDKKRVNFKNFAKKSSIIIISAGTLRLEKNDNKYYLNFSDSDIDYPLNISFNLLYKLNDDEENKTTICNLTDNTKDIICELKDLESDVINVEILKNPVEQYLERQTISFINFAQKKIITFYGGIIQKGKCYDEKYIFNFINATSLYNFDNNISFYLQMKIPYRIAICTITRKNTNTNSNSIMETIFYNVECTIEGSLSCPVESDDDDITVGDFEPSPYQINNNSYIYYTHFYNQSTKDYYLHTGEAYEVLFFHSCGNECNSFFKDRLNMMYIVL